MYQFRSLHNVTLLLVSLLLCSCYVKKGCCQDDCAQGFPDIADSADQSSDSLTKQLVIPQYTFHCSAIITQWEAIVHIEKESYTIQFQIWRWNHTVRGYQLVGSNQFHRLKQASSGMQKEVKQTYTVEPHARLQVAPADIVGVFASDISVHYKSDDVIDVYAAEEVDHPLVGIFAPLNLDPAFNRRIDGAPLIAVQTDTTNVVLRTPAISHPETQPEGDTDTTMGPLATLPFNETTLYRSGSTLDSTTWTQHKELIIGVTICGVALILFSIGIIATITLYIRASKRKRIASIEATDGTQTPRRSFFPFPFRKRPAGSLARDLLNGTRGSGDVRGIHRTVLLTQSHSANTETDHSYAYINSDLISSNPRPLMRSSRPPALPPERISVRQNPCYSATPAASTEDLTKSASEQRVENVYDLPVFFTQTTRQAREYEVPIRSPSSKSKTAGKAQHFYELTSDNNKVATN